MFRKSKAQTLKFLEKKVKNSKVLPSLIFNVNEKKSILIKNIQSIFNSKIIVRSSSINEDTEKTSNAGYYTSVLDIEASNESQIIKAVNTVISSFGKNCHTQDEILIQPMLKNVIASGVVFTCDLDTLSSYYIINYDLSEETTNVTEGKGKELKTYIEYKYLTKQKRNNKFLDHLILAIKEIESILNNQFLDIEFGYDGKDIYIFQARPISKNNKNNLSHINLEKALFKLYKKVNKLNQPHPNLLGDYTMFGVMPDWNPAEIIGKKPKPLSLSLYKELITNTIWAYQRDNYGYRNLRSHPLLVSFLGVAYIDIRVSFNSFIPKALNKKVASKLVNYYLNTLKKTPSKHDKIEFDIILSCFDFSTNDKLKELLNKKFSVTDIKNIKKSLLNLTNDIFTLYKKDLKKIEVLKSKYNDIVHSSLSTIDKIYWLNEDCKRYGTLPFSGLARAAFVSMSFLNSFLDKNILSKKEYTLFLNSLHTISKKLNTEYSTLDKNAFLNIYGHLRPGTYEITSKRYDENFEKYFASNSSTVKKTSFKFGDQHIKLIDIYLKNNGIKLKATQLIQFMTKSIEAREYSKFIFTKSLSKILSLIESLGIKYSISKEDLSYLDYNTVLSLYSSLNFDDIKILFRNEIKKNKKAYEITQGIKLPDLLKNENEIYSFFNFESSANFITLNNIESNTVQEQDIYTKDLENKIICIKSADPGYDFLFTKNIGALITCYGGANSHMSIRCAELNIPAVIGIGENEYLDINKYNIISIDCKIQKIKKIR